ncbi:sulfite exporter TauE/SafE family protein [Thiolapillus sp.]
MTWYLAYAALGAVAGILAGLMGVGGGLVFVPGLLLLFHLQDFDARWLSHLAIGTSLALIVPTALSSLWAHHRRGAVDWPAVLRLTPGLLAGAALGAWLAARFSTEGLKTLFALFLFLVAWQMLTGAMPRSRARDHGAGLFLSVGAVIGTVSGLVGIGGGTMTVPFLLWQGKPLPKAVATSAACGLPIALAGALGFMITGAGRTAGAATGFVYWPAVLLTGISAVLLAPLGARLAHTLPVPLLKRFFALLLALVGLRLLLAG